VSLRDDVMMRSIHQLVEALLRAVGLRRKKDLPAAEQALGEGLSSLGLPLELLARVDVATLRSLVADPTRRALLAGTLSELSALRDAQGRVSDALALRERAAALLDDVDPASLPEPVQDALTRARMPW
jgi:hypothetical protein